MREIFTYGSVGGAAGQPPLLPGSGPENVWHPSLVFCGL